MKNSTSTTNPPKQASWLLISLILCFIIGFFLWLLLKNDDEALSQINQPIVPIKQVVTIEPKKIIEVAKPIVDEVVAPEPIVEEVAVENLLPALDESDSWLQEKLSLMSWRKELLKLVVHDDMVRRLVVFTDNFTQGIVAYQYSPFVLPKLPFTAVKTDIVDVNELKEWQWDKESERRFSLYVDLLRSIDSDTLVQWYFDVKPLIDQAYAELGYPDDDFTDTLQSAITRVLGMELPKEPLKIIQPSVMYKYQNPEVEALDDADKLLLRLGQENVLVIKSVLLEFSDKLSRGKNE